MTTIGLNISLPGREDPNPEGSLKVNSHRSKNEAGLTLVEILFASAIGAVLLMSLALASGFFVDSYSAGLDEQDLALSHHIALDRILSAITTAGTVTVESATSLLRDAAAGGTDRFVWSGNPGDSLNLIRDGGDAVPFVDGVTNLCFTANTVDVVEESRETVTEEILNFDFFEGETQEWEDLTLAEGCMYGFTFNVVYTHEVEKMELTSMDVKIGKIAGQGGDLRVSLYEGQNEERPRVWGDPIISHEVLNSDIPLADGSGESLIIDWMTIALPEEFIVQPNRFYCLMFEPVGSAEGGIVRVAHITGGTGPINQMAWLGTDDGGASWEPVLKTQEYRQRDVPIRIQSEVTLILRSAVTKVESVDVTLGLRLGDVTIEGTGRADVRGGGELTPF